MKKDNDMLPSSKRKKRDFLLNANVELFLLRHWSFNFAMEECTIVQEIWRKIKTEKILFGRNY